MAVETAVDLQIELIGFRLDVDSEGQPDLYTLYVDADRPIVSDQSIVFFADPRQACQAVERDDDDEVRRLAPPHDLAVVYDVPLALYRLAHQSFDPDSVILNCLNVLFDLVKATGLPPVGAVKDELYPLADHLTFDREDGSYLDAAPKRRGRVIDAVLWCIGAVVSHATVLRPDSAFEPSPKPGP
jgi:hypothetical protein